MYAVIFEVEPKPGRRQDYLDLAAALRPELERIDGFLSIERFQSLSGEGKILSLSFWRDAASVRRWREHEGHRRAQARGRAEIFADYRLSVVEVVRQYGLHDRAEAPLPQKPIPT
jgi:heme-degrading monooxygenase HmoA